MGVKLPNGSTVSMSSLYAAAILITAISNASPAVVTAAAHGLEDGDIVYVNSGWSDISGRVVRVIEITADSFALEGIDTSDADRFIPGSGVGSVLKIETWQQISQILDTSSSGGEQQFWNYSFLEDTGDEKQIPTNRTPSSMALQVADDPSLPQTAVLEQANTDRLPRAIVVRTVAGALTYFGAWVSVSDIPTMTKNEGMANTVTLSKTGRATRYAGAQV